MHKKNLPPERNGSNLFLIYPTSHSLHCTRASFSITQAAFLVACECAVCRDSATLFLYPIIQRLCPALSPLHLPLPRLFYLLRLPRANAVISRAFSRLSHQRAALFFKKPSPTAALDALPPAAPDPAGETQQTTSNLP